MATHGAARPPHRSPMNEQPTASQAAGAAGFLTGGALGLITGVVLLVATIIRPDDGHNSAPPLLVALLANIVAPFVIMTVGLLLHTIGSAASSRQGCISALSGSLLSLIGGTTVGLTISIYGGALLAALPRAVITW